MDTAMTNVIKSKEKCLSVPYTVKAKKNLIRLQGEHMKRTGKFITVKSIASKVLETATL